MLKLISTPELARKYQVVREDGLPDVVLTVFTDELQRSLSPASVPIYMREVLSAFNWAMTDKVVVRNCWRLIGSPVEVRNVVREYLTVGAKCKLQTRADRLGVKVTYVRQTDRTHINVRIFLASLRRLFDHLIGSGQYEHANPLVHEDMADFVGRSYARPIAVHPIWDLNRRHPLTRETHGTRMALLTGGRSCSDMRPFDSQCRPHSGQPNSNHFTQP